MNEAELKPFFLTVMNEIEASEPRQKDILRFAYLERHPFKVKARSSQNLKLMPTYEEMMRLLEQKDPMLAHAMMRMTKEERK
jgi:hypothetical protein